MKLDLVLCLATAAYAAPIPVLTARQRAQRAFEKTIEASRQAILKQKDNHGERVPLAIRLMLEKLPGKKASYTRLQKKQTLALQNWQIDLMNLKQMQREVDDLKTMHDDLNGQGRVGFNSPAWQYWSREYSKETGELPDIQKVFPFAQSKQKLAEASLEKERIALGKLTDAEALLANRLRHDKIQHVKKNAGQVLEKHREKVDILEREVEELNQMKGTAEKPGLVVFNSPSWIKWSKQYLDANPGEQADITKVHSFAESKLESARNRLERQKITLREATNLSNHFGTILQQRRDLQYLRSRIGKGLPNGQQDEVYAKWQKEFRVVKKRPVENLKELVDFVQEYSIVPGFKF
jgi:hypothetical protein